MSTLASSTISRRTSYTSLDDADSDLGSVLGYHVNLEELGSGDECLGAFVSVVRAVMEASVCVLHLCDDELVSMTIHDRTSDIMQVRWARARVCDVLHSESSQGVSHIRLRIPYTHSVRGAPYSRRVT